MPNIDSVGTEYKLSIVRSKVNSEVINPMNPFGTSSILPGLSLGKLLCFQSHAGDNHSQFPLVAAGTGRKSFIKPEINTQSLSTQ